MSFWYLIGIALALAMDAFAVSLASCCRLRHLEVGNVVRPALAFGFFQFMMTALGWLAGKGLTRWISAVDHWVVFVLLAIIGGRMIWESFGSHEGSSKDPTRGWMLLTLAVATSLDALAVGVSLAVLNVSIWVPSVVIGIVAAVLTTIGSLFGSRLGRRFGVWAERFGGLVLIGIGLRLLISHLF
jgi:manganese efflux pump family protein